MVFSIFLLNVTSSFQNAWQLGVRHYRAPSQYDFGNYERVGFKFYPPYYTRSLPPLSPFRLLPVVHGTCGRINSANISMGFIQLELLLEHNMFPGPLESLADYSQQRWKRLLRLQWISIIILASCKASTIPNLGFIRDLVLSQLKNRVVYKKSKPIWTYE